ncbi:MAG: S-layer homology domain-containing protein [Acidimicrobiales bacterium]|nr:S-layer homology domain-containing protein [Acidimicrobiales bacterium]
MFKRTAVSALTILVATLGSLALAPPAGSVAGFGDVPGQIFYTDAVQWMADNNITAGTSPTCFSPNGYVTRGQAAAFMWRMEGSPSAPVHPFNDVSKSWQQGPVSWMYANAITSGTTSLTYSPEDTLTRGQLAALLFRLAGNPAGSPAHLFNDVVRPWQQDAISWMSDQGITTGTTSLTFSPEATVTRGQLATFFYRYKGKPAVTVDASSPFCARPPDRFETFVATIKPNYGLIDPRVAPDHNSDLLALEYPLLNPTYHNHPLVLMVTARTSDGQWLKVQVPSRPNGTEGWIPATQATLSTHFMHASLNLTSRVLKVWNGDVLIAETQAVIGRSGTPTPLGRFFISDLVEKSPGSFFGPYVMTLSAFSETLATFQGGIPVISIHGTSQPWLIGGAHSNGCIRIPNDVVTFLAANVPMGTPIEISA